MDENYHLSVQMKGVYSKIHPPKPTAIFGEAS